MEYRHTCGSQPLGFWEGGWWAQRRNKGYRPASPPRFSNNNSIPSMVDILEGIAAFSSVNKALMDSHSRLHNFTKKEKETSKHHGVHPLQGFTDELCWEAKRWPMDSSHLWSASQTGHIQMVSRWPQNWVDWGRFHKVCSSGMWYVKAGIWNTLLNLNPREKTHTPALHFCSWRMLHYQITQWRTTMNKLYWTSI